MLIKRVAVRVAWVKEFTVSFRAVSGALLIFYKVIVCEYRNCQVV